MPAICAAHHYEQASARNAVGAVHTPAHAKPAISEPKASALDVALSLGVSAEAYRSPSSTRSTRLAQPTPQRKHQMQRRASLKLVLLRRLVVGPVTRVSAPAAIPLRPAPHGIYSISVLYSHLLPSINQPLLLRRDALLLLHALLDPRDFVVGLDVQLDFFAGEGADPGWSLSLAVYLWLGSGSGRG